MSYSRTVQAQDIEGTLELYRLRKVPPFAIFAGNQLLFSENATSMGEGEQILEQYLMILDRSQSMGIYTLCVYDRLEEGALIDNKMKYHGSINFRLKENTPGFQQGNGLLNENRSLLMSIDKRLQQLEEEKEEPEDQGVMGAIGAVLNSGIIEQLPMIIGLIRELAAPKPQGQIPASDHLGAINPQIGQDQLTEAMEVLKAKVPDFPEIMCKLARIATKNPIRFTGYMLIIRALKE
jgi:hypothetical protein